MKKYQIVGLPRRFQDGGGTSYSVKSGDSFDAIAYANGFNPSELRAANPGISYGNLSIGQVINFPKKKAVKKTITKPATQVAKKVGTGLFSKMMKAAKAVGEKEIYNDYFNQLRSQENAAKVGWDPKTKLWKPYPAPEKGGGYDIGPGLKLSGLSKKRDWYKGITTEEMNTMMKKIFEEKKKYASNYINKTYGKGTFENLSVPQQIILTDYQYNVAGGIEEFPNFAKGVVNNDVDLMLKEHVRTSDGKPLGRRNQFTVDWINRYFAKKQEEALPKKYEGGALPKAQSGVQVPRDKRKAFNKFLDDWAESSSYYEWNPDGTPVTMEQRVEEFYKSLQAANQQPTSVKIVQSKSPDKETWADRRRFKKFIKATMDDIYGNYAFRDIPEGKYNLATSVYKKVLNPNYIFDDPDTPNVNEEQEAILSGKQAPEMKYLIDLPTQDIAEGKNKKGLFKKWKARREKAEMMNHVIAGLRGYGDLPMGYNDEDWKKYIDKYESLIQEYKDEQYEDLQEKEYLEALKDWKKKRGRYSGSMGQSYWLNDYRQNNWARFDPATVTEDFPGQWKLMSDLGTEEKRKTFQTQLRMLTEIGGAGVVRTYKEPGKTVEEFKKGVGDLYDVATTDKTLDDIELGQGFYDGLFVGTLPIGTGLYTGAGKGVMNIGKYTYGLGKGTRSLNLVNKSNLPLSFRYTNPRGNIDVGFGNPPWAGWAGAVDDATSLINLDAGILGQAELSLPKTAVPRYVHPHPPAYAPLSLTTTKESLMLSSPKITSSVIPNTKIIEPTPSVPVQKTEKINHYATNNPDGSIVFDHFANFHTGLVAPDDAGQFMNTWKTDGYIFDEAAKTMKPKSKTSFKTLDENGKIADLKNSEGNVSTEKALRIMEKDESASSLKVSRIKKELENRYDGTIPAEISFDELNDVANSTIIPLNIKVTKNGNPTYGYENVGYDDFIFNDDIDPSNISKTKEAYKQTFEDAKNLPQKQIEIGDKLFQARVINKDLNAERNAISAEILAYQESGFEKWWKRVYDEGDNITLMTARKRYRLELQNDPTYQKLVAEQQEASQAVGKQDLVVFELEKEQRLIDEKLSKLRASKKTSFSSKRMRDQNVNNFTIYPRQLVFSNKSEFPGFGVNAHNAGADALGRVYASVRSNTPNTLTTTQIQTEFSQKQFGRNQTSMPLLKNQLAVNEFSEIIAQATRDVVKNFGIDDMLYTPTGEELLTDAGYVRGVDSTGKKYYVKGNRGDEDYDFFWGPNQGSMIYGIKVQRLKDAYRAKHPIDYDFVDAQKAKQEQIQADINYINAAFKDGLSDAQKTRYQGVELQTVINRVEDVLGRSLFDLGPTTENYNIAKGAIKKQMDVVPDAKLFQKYNYERMVQETVDYAARNNFKKVRFPTGATANKVQNYDIHHQSRANYNLKNISEIPKDGNPVNLGAAIHNNIDINKAEAVISKNLTQDQRIKLITALNDEIRHTGLGDAVAPNRLTVDEIVDIATSDEPLWQYVKEKVSTGEGTKTTRTFKSKYFTEEDVDKIKTLNSEGKRLTNYFKKYKDSPTGRGGDDQWKLLEDGRFRILDRYENLDKLLKKYYPDAKIEKVSDEYGNTWWELTFPKSVLKGTKPTVPYKQGGSVEANLSPEDVERYVKGGYILEELD